MSIQEENSRPFTEEAPLFPKKRLPFIDKHDILYISKEGREWPTLNMPARCWGYEYERASEGTKKDSSVTMFGWRKLEW